MIHGIQDFRTSRRIGEPNLQAISNSLDEYVYQTLSDEEKLVYNQIYECMEGFIEKVPLSTKDEKTVRKCFDSVLADHGELFYWVYGYSLVTYKNDNDGYVSGVSFTPDYTMTREEKEATDAMILSVYQEWIKDLPPSSDDYTKSKYVYEKLIQEVKYVSGAEDNQNIKSVFLNRETVCKGYANSVAYFFDKLDIPCTVIVGEGNNESHAWNLIKLDGDYYYFDVTWGNSSYRNEGVKERRTNYSYLNATGEEIFKTHRAEVSFPLPECISFRDNYFIREGLFLTPENYDEMGRMIYDSFSSDKSSVSLKFQNESLFNMAINHLFEEKHFSDYCPGTDRISYLLDEEICTLTIIF